MLPFLYAFCIGFAMQMPIGPTALLCVRRFAAGGVPLAAATGLGTALGDAFYAGIAVAGLHGWQAAIERHEAFLRVVGGLTLVAVGSALALKRIGTSLQSAASRNGIYGAFASTFFMTLLNPATVVLVAGVLSGLGLFSLMKSAWSVLFFIVGFLLGACGWWILFALLLRVLHRRVGNMFFLQGSRISGVAIATVGVVILVIHRLHSL